MNPDNNLYVVITTINHKTRGIRDYEAMSGLNVVLVGDKKTPQLEDGVNSRFLELSDQGRLGFSLASKLPLNHYARKNIGYLYAMRQGAAIIYDTDDDNYPLENWYVPEFKSSKRLSCSDWFCNVYSYFTGMKVWPRGLPLRFVNRQDTLTTESIQQSSIGVWQGLADGDPDVDAIYRLVINEQVIFDKREGVWLPPHIYCPFNSQNTFWKRECFTLLYLPSTTSFRFTDILRGYVAQRLLWEEGHCLGFMGASVYQERNAHDYMKDFEDEVDVYLRAETVVKILEELHLNGSIEQNIRQVYKALFEASIVTAEELILLDLWIGDCAEVLGGLK